MNRRPPDTGAGEGSLVGTPKVGRTPAELVIKIDALKRTITSARENGFENLAVLLEGALAELLAAAQPGIGGVTARAAEATAPSTQVIKGPPAADRKRRRPAGYKEYRSRYDAERYEGHKLKTAALVHEWHEMSDEERAEWLRERARNV